MVEPRPPRDPPSPRLGFGRIDLPAFFKSLSSPSAAAVSSGDIEAITRSMGSMVRVYAELMSGESSGLPWRNTTSPRTGALAPQPLLSDPHGESDPRVPEFCRKDSAIPQEGLCSGSNCGVDSHRR